MEMEKELNVMLKEKSTQLADIMDNIYWCRHNL